MRPILYLLFVFLALVSCNTNPNKTANAPASVPDTIVIEGDNQGPSSQIDSVDTDSTAISNIKFCISSNEFNNRKKTFLNKHPNLGHFKIAAINGFFYNDSLVGIEIISAQQNAFRNTSNDFVGWEDLFKEKYRERYDPLTGGYETSVKIIFVTDFCSQHKSSNTLNELMDREYPILTYKAHLPNIKFKDNVQGMLYASLAFENVKSSRGQRLYERMNRELADVHGDYLSPTTPIYQRYYEEIRDEANRNIETYNNSIKDSPSWSIIRIIFKPFKNKYYEDIEKNREQNDLENFKDVDII